MLVEWGYDADCSTALDLVLLATVVHGLHNDRPSLDADAKLRALLIRQKAPQHLDCLGIHGNCQTCLSGW